jgi:hypothetical protein
MTFGQIGRSQGLSTTQAERAYADSRRWNVKPERPS